jgi:hypothetical protein
MQRQRDEEVKVALLHPTALPLGGRHIRRREEEVVPGKVSPHYRETMTGFRGGGGGGDDDGMTLAVRFVLLAWRVCSHASDSRGKKGTYQSLIRAKKDSS